VQASRAWSPPTGTLGGILAEARDRVDLLRTREKELRTTVESAPSGPSLALALRGSAVAVIAEVKRRSPSKGWINPSISSDEQARAYERGGAAAISILTEPVHFGGSDEDLKQVREAVGLPTIKKGFHVDPVQLVEAKALGASAALLIARALSPEDLSRMMEAAIQLDLEVLVEVRDEEELARALSLNAPIIGVNSRNLETLEVDAAVADRLLRQIPPDRLAVAESGVRGRADVERLAKHGADAVLVGSTVSAASDPADAVRSLVGVSRVARHG
jgi:indole-3-glycerol phosphate synthase